MRQAGDRPGEATALTDLGIAATNRGDVPQALAHLEQALALALRPGRPGPGKRRPGQPGPAALAAGQLERAQQCLEQELAYTRAAGDRFAEKLALDRLGTVHAARGHLPVCMALLQEALALTRILGDRQHEADLLWHLAIRHAEGGQRDETLAQAQAAVEVLERLGKPEARIYAEHLQKYRRGETGGSGWPRQKCPGRGVRLGSGQAMGDERDDGFSDAPSGPGGRSKQSGAAAMAITAAKALTDFLGSGLQTVAAEVRQKRLQACGRCPHHTGLRAGSAAASLRSRAACRTRTAPWGNGLRTRQPNTIRKHVPGVVGNGSRLCREFHTNRFGDKNKFSRPSGTQTGHGAGAGPGLKSWASLNRPSGTPKSWSICAVRAEIGLTSVLRCATV